MKVPKWPFHDSSYKDLTQLLALVKQVGELQPFSWALSLARVEIMSFHLEPVVRLGMLQPFFLDSQVNKSSFSSTFGVMTRISLTVQVLEKRMPHRPAHQNLYVHWSSQERDWHDVVSSDYGNDHPDVRNFVRWDCIIRMSNAHMDLCQMQTTSLLCLEYTRFAVHTMQLSKMWSHVHFCCIQV